MTQDELLVIIQRQTAELERLKGTATKGALHFKVSEKGGVSVYGLGRFPVTLYAGQWDKLFGVLDSLKSFITDNMSKLSVKA